MPTYNSEHTGTEIDAAIKKALLLDEFTTATTVNISGVLYYTLWKKDPATQSDIYGIAVNPTTGKLYQIYKNTSNIYSATPYTAAESSTAGNRAANTAVLTNAAGTIQTEKLAISSGATTKAHMEYNATEDCIDFIFD